MRRTLSGSEAANRFWPTQLKVYGMLFASKVDADLLEIGVLSTLIAWGKPMKTLATIFFLVALAPAAVAADRTLFAEPLSSQTVEYERGNAFVTSRSNSTTVILVPEITSGSMATLRFTVFNGGDTSFTIYENAVTAEMARGSIEILGAAALEKKEKRKRFWENVGAGLAIGANSYTAAQQGHTTSTSYHSGTVTARTPDGRINADFEGTSTTYSYDAQANQQAVSDANRNNAQLMANLQAEQTARRSSLEASVLKTQTVQSGASYSGFVQMKLPRSSRGQATMVNVSFSAGPETHRFYLFVDGQPTSEQRAQVLGQPIRQIASTSTIPAEQIGGNQHAMRNPTSNESSQTQYQETRSMDAEVKNQPDSESMPITRAIATPRLTGLLIESKDDNAGAKKAYAFFDIEWTIAPPTTKKMVGKLILVDKDGKERVSMPWTIAAEDAAKGAFTETQTGFELLSFGQAQNWLRLSDATDIRARFIANP